MSLSDLPDIQFIDTDPNKITASIIALYESITDRKLFPGDPVRLFLLTISNIIVHQQTLINDTGKQNLLRYSRGDVLDHIGMLVNTTRLSEIPAVTQVRWWVSIPQPDVVSIPKGTRISPDGNLFFATIEEGKISPGQDYVDVLCECLTPGTVGNNFLPNQINQIVDPLPWIERAQNIIESNGGADREDDDRYRERIREAPESFSTAGPDGAYKFWAKTTHPEIEDVDVHSPSPGYAELRILLTNGRIPEKEMLDAIYAKCNDRKIRPLTDKIQVLAAEEIKYKIDMSYWIDAEDMDKTEDIKKKVQQAVDDYIVWQRKKLGRDINPSELNLKVRQAGAYRVEIRSPIFTNISRRQFASANTMNVVYGGIEDVES
ncbi:baseplate J/gp47 family protein [Brevibacillus laterosporus]|uniref:baseplate assembly protein n=1 Tax=Brevibacillus laterosporus TaxID=1465 RepID=UPI003D19E9ED